MSRSYEFLKECKVFYVLTVNAGRPAGRPFGAVMEYENTLYFSTADTKDVYRQLTEDPNIQILALKPGTRDWLRINGRAAECRDMHIRQKMLEECPALRKHFDSPECEHFAVFGVEEKEAYLNVDNEFIEID